MMSDGNYLFAPGDEIGVFKSTGECCGIGVWPASGPCTFTIHGYAEPSLGLIGGFDENQDMFFKIYKNGVTYSNLKIVFAEYIVYEDNPPTLAYTDSKYHHQGLYSIAYIGLSKPVNVTCRFHGAYSATNGCYPIPLSMELRSGATMTASTLVKRTSGILSPTGVLSCDFGDVVDGSYWLVVRGAGYLPLASTSQIALNSTTAATYNFTTASTATTAGAAAVIDINGIFYARAGDVTGDCRTSAPLDYTPIIKPSGTRNVSAVPVATSYSTTETITAPSKLLTITLGLHGLASSTTHKQAAVAVELRTGGTSVTGSTLEHVRTGLIDPLTHTVTVDFGGVPDGNYWVVVRAAGYLPLASTSQILLSAVTPATYNFTSASTQSVAGAAAVVDIGSTYFCARAGDFNFDCRTSAPLDYTPIIKPSGTRNVAAVPAL